jgi:hypothetical protein
VTLSRVCSTCREEKPLDSFHNDKNKPGGKAYLCKPCNIAKVGDWQRRNATRKLENSRRSASNNTQKGTYFVEDLAHLPGNTWQCVATRLIKRAQRNAKKRGIEFGLTQTDILPMLRVGSCPLSGYKFRYTYGAYDAYAPSLDRIDSDKGYVPGNVRIVCFLLNVGMNQFGFDVAADLWNAVLARRATRAAA